MFSPRGGFCETIRSLENLALFRPANVTAESGGGLSLAVIQEPWAFGISALPRSRARQFSVRAFEVTLQATNVSGLVTGFFLHRDSPGKRSILKSREIANAGLGQCVL
jgi:hypothetical protein